MLKLSKMTDYAVVVMSVMDKSPRSAVQLAQKVSLPEPTVAKLLKLLAKDGVISAHRGAHGGYGLDKELAQIAILDVITAIDGPVALTNCVHKTPDTCAIESSCALSGHWDMVNEAIVSALQDITLADMMANSVPRAQAV